MNHQKSLFYMFFLKKVFLLCFREILLEILSFSVYSARINIVIHWGEGGGKVKGENGRRGGEPKFKSTIVLSLWNRQLLIIYTSGKSLSNARM